MTETQTSLLVRHLPSVLSDQEKIDLLCHFGARSVHTMGVHGSLKHCAFARFSSQESAERAMKRMHQLDVLGCRLVVEFAKEHLKHDISEGQTKKSEEVETNKDLKKEVKNDTMPSNIDEAFHKQNIQYPKKPTLCYIYPPPTVSILTNIANALASHSKFYTQVLHLMNKMNLPCPFGPVTPSPPLALEKSEQHGEVPKRKYTDTAAEIEEVEMEYVSTEESELESDSENKDNKKDTSSKVVRKASVKRPIKRLRVAQQPMPNVVKPAVSHTPGEVFEAPSDVRHTQIQFNISEKDILEQLEKSRIESENLMKQEGYVTEGGFGKVEPQKKEELKTQVEKRDVDYKIDRNLFLNKKAIAEGRLKPEQFKDFSVFKKYSPGEVTSRLYIKNLTKHTSEQDLVNLFGSFIDWSQDLAVETFDVRVMKEGRMKGQAFVTLPADNEANQIVEECNGFILNSKPIVIHFARSAKAKQVDKPVE